MRHPVIELARVRDSYIVKLEPDNGRRSLSNDENCTLFLGGPVCSLMGYGPTNSPNLRTGSPYFNIGGGGFHLYLLVFPFIYHFYSRIEALVSSSFAND